MPKRFKSFSLPRINIASTKKKKNNRDNNDKDNNYIHNYSLLMSEEEHNSKNTAMNTPMKNDDEIGNGVDVIMTWKRKGLPHILLFFSTVILLAASICRLAPVAAIYLLFFFIINQLSYKHLSSWIVIFTCLTIVAVVTCLGHALVLISNSIDSFKLSEIVIRTFEPVDVVSADTFLLYVVPDIVVAIFAILALCFAKRERLRMANAVEMVGNYEHNDERKQSEDNHDVNEDKKFITMSFSICCCSQKFINDAYRAFWNYGTVLALLTGCVLNISIITCFTYLIFLATLVIWGARIGRFRFFYEKSIFLIKNFIFFVVISWYVSLLCTADDSNLENDLDKVFYNIGFRGLSWKEPNWYNWGSYFSFLFLFLGCTHIESMRSQMLYSSNLFYKNNSKNDDERIQDESFMEQASKSLLENDAMSLESDNHRVLTITEGKETFSKHPSSYMSSVTGFFNMEISKSTHTAIFVGLVLLWPCTFPTATILFMPLVLWATLALCLSFTPIINTLTHRRTLTFIYMYSILLSLTMFICDLHVIKYSFGISKDSSSVDTLPSFLGVAWSSLGGKRIFTQSIVLMILSWNLRALSDRKYVEMIPK